MSPTLAFPPRFRHHDLPPYGPADWKRVQPVLLRRSLALSSGVSLVAGLLLGIVLHQAAVQAPVKTTFIWEAPPAAPPEPGYQDPKLVPPTKIQNNGSVLPVPRDIPTLQDSLIPPSNPGLFDPNATAPTGTIPIPGNAVGGKVEAPERPDPGAYVALDEQPKEVYSPKPEYPEIARQANMEGTVVLNVLVNREGNVQEVILVKSSPVFDEAAEQAIRRWRFRPAILDHEPVAAWVHIPVRFVISGE